MTKYYWDITNVSKGYAEMDIYKKDNFKPYHSKTIKITKKSITDLIDYYSDLIDDHEDDSRIAEGYALKFFKTAKEFNFKSYFEVEFKGGIIEYYSTFKDARNSVILRFNADKLTN
jgi:hypothetical protein